MKNHFVNGGTYPALAAFTAHHGFQKEALLAEVFPFQDVVQLLQGVVRVEIGQKTKIPTVDTNNFNVIARKNARGTEHITITADDHSQIGFFANISQTAGLCALKFKILSNLTFNHNLIAFRD